MVQLEETNIFTTNAADEALQALPHSLSNIITASILTLVEERRVECVHHMCGAHLHLLVVTAEQSSQKQDSGKRPVGRINSKGGHMVPQGRASGRMGSAVQEQSGDHLSHTRLQTTSLPDAAANLERSKFIVSGILVL